jgi:hypothetical protein
MFPRLMALEGAAFAIASIIHSGAFVRVSVDPGASTAEGVIAAVLLIGAVVAGVRPNWTRPVASLAQGFGLAGSLIGLYLMTRGIAPNTVPDAIFHVVVVITLAVGLAAAIRATSGNHVVNAI